MKTEFVSFRLRPHEYLEKQVVEIWQGNEFIGTLTATGDHGEFRVISKFAIRCAQEVNAPGSPTSFAIRVFAQH